MDTWSNKIYNCDFCQIRYAPRMQNTRHKGHNFCSFKCKEDWIDADNAINGMASYDDNPQRDLFDWSYNRIG